MMKFFRQAALTFSLLVLISTSGCSLRQRVQPVALSKGVSFTLEEPASFGRELSLTQKLEVFYLDERTAKRVTREVVVQLEIDSKAMRLMALGQMGISLFQMHWDGKRLEVKKPPAVELPFAPEYLIANMQLALWESFPSNQNLDLTDTPKKRVLNINHEPALVITYPQGKTGLEEIRIQDLTKNFSITITRLE